jgi:hypothetical protein
MRIMIVLRHDCIYALGAHLGSWTSPWIIAEVAIARVGNAQGRVCHVLQQCTICKGAAAAAASYLAGGWLLDAINDVVDQS